MRQIDIARAVGVSRSLVCRWESGQTIPATHHLPALAAVLGLSDAELGELVRSFPASADSEAA